MSEENSRADPKITAVKKEKDPKCIEAGKRLAQLDKEQQGQIDDNKTAVNYILILNAMGFTVAVISLYYVRKEYYIKAVRKAKKEENPQVEPPQTKEKLQKVVHCIEVHCIKSWLENKEQVIICMEKPSIEEYVP